MDGELFKTEVAQRLFLWLKTQASESLASLFSEKSLSEYTRAIDTYKAWPQQVAEEELASLETRAGGAEELKQVWTAVSAQWVRLTRKSENSKASVKIRTPEPRLILKAFFMNLVQKTWCVRGELWAMDPVKQDFVFREAFRQAVSESVHIVEDAKDDAKPESEPVKQELKSEPKPEPKEVPKPAEPEPKEVPKPAEPEPKDLLKPAEPDTLEPEPKPASQEEPKEEIKEPKEEAQPKAQHAHYTEALQDEDDIGPDDSVSQFYGAASVMTKQPPQPVAPMRRFADAGTVLYPSQPKKSVQPLKIQLQEPIAKPDA